VATIQIPNCPNSSKTVRAQGGGLYSSFSIDTSTYGWDDYQLWYTDANNTSYYLVWNYADSPYLTIS